MSSITWSKIGQLAKITPDSHSAVNSSLTKRSKILLPPLHIKLGLAKQFVKALKLTSRAFYHIRHIFPSISEAKVKRSTTFGRGKKGADNKGATKRVQNKKGAEQKGCRTKRARDHDVASPLHSRS